MLTHSIGWRFQTSFSKTRRNISPQQSRARVKTSTSTSFFDVVAFDRVCSDDDGEEPSEESTSFLEKIGSNFPPQFFLKKRRMKTRRRELDVREPADQQRTMLVEFIVAGAHSSRDRKIEPPIQHHQCLHGVFSFSENASSHLNSRRA